MLSHDHPRFSDPDYDPYPQRLDDYDELEYWKEEEMTYIWQADKDSSPDRRAAVNEHNKEIKQILSDVEDCLFWLKGREGDGVDECRLRLDDLARELREDDGK